MAVGPAGCPNLRSRSLRCCPLPYLAMESAAFRRDRSAQHRLLLDQQLAVATSGARCHVALSVLSPGASSWRHVWIGVSAQGAVARAGPSRGAKLHGGWG